MTADLRSQHASEREAMRGFLGSLAVFLAGLLTLVFVLLWLNVTVADVDAEAPAAATPAAESSGIPPDRGDPS